MKPATGSSDPAAGDPGTLYLGDVGWGTWEEVNVVRSGGENFGWPNMEGMSPHNGYSGYVRPNNWLGMPDGASLGGKADPAAFTVHATPLVAWHHGNAGLLQPPGLHNGFKGNSATGGDFYVGNAYPALYSGANFFADYGQSWIKAIRVTADDQPIEILDFATGTDGPVDLTRHPVTGDIYYVSVFTGEVRRIQFGSNTAPQAQLVVSPTAGTAPLRVEFDAGASSDGQQPASTLRFDWSFGDGSAQFDAGATVEHTYESSGTWVAEVRVTDFDGAVANATVTINVDNTPPVAVIAAPTDGSLYDPIGQALVPLVGAGIDAQDPESALSFDWEVRLHHLDAADPSQEHIHPDVYSSTLKTDDFEVEAHGNDGDIINYEVILTVTDSDGASDTANAFILDPRNDCGFRK